MNGLVRADETTDNSDEGEVDGRILQSWRILSERTKRERIGKPSGPHVA